MAKPPHTSAEMRVFYPVFRWRELAAGYRYTTKNCLTGQYRILAHSGPCWRVHDPLCVRRWLALPSPEGFHLVRKLARPCPHVFVGSVERRRVIAQALTHRDCYQLLQVDIFVVG